MHTVGDIVFRGPDGFGKVVGYEKLANGEDEYTVQWQDGGTMKCCPTSINIFKILLAKRLDPKTRR